MKKKKEYGTDEYTLVERKIKLYFGNKVKYNIKCEHHWYHCAAAVQDKLYESGTGTTEYEARIEAMERLIEIFEEILSDERSTNPYCINYKIQNIKFH